MPKFLTPFVLWVAGTACLALCAYLVNGVAPAAGVLGTSLLCVAFILGLRKL